MSIRFPYEKIEKNERVVIYGAGVLGQELFWQIRKGSYCTLAGITDRQFDDDVKLPLFPLNKLLSIPFDKIIIASLSPKIIETVRKYLLENNIPSESIISEYPFDDIAFAPLPTAKAFADEFECRRELIDICESSASEFAGTFFYQSLPILGISGKRDSMERLSAYQVTEYLDSTYSALDIGCNCGFLDLQIASSVKSIKGVDVDDGLIKMAKYAQHHLQIENVSFERRDIFKKELDEQFDAVFLLSIHATILRYSDMTDVEFVNKILRLVRKNGLIFFESHAYLPGEADELYDRIRKIFLVNGLDLISYRHHYGKTPGNCNRDISVYRCG